MCVRLLSPLSPEVEHCESIGREFNRPISQLALLKKVYAMVLQEINVRPCIGALHWTHQKSYLVTLPHFMGDTSHGRIGISEIVDKKPKYMCTYISKSLRSLCYSCHVTIISGIQFWTHYTDIRSSPADHQVQGHGGGYRALQQHDVRSGCRMLH